MVNPALNYRGPEPPKRASLLKLVLIAISIVALALVAAAILAYLDLPEPGFISATT